VNDDSSLELTGKLYTSLAMPYFARAPQRRHPLAEDLRSTPTYLLLPYPPALLGVLALVGALLGLVVDKRAVVARGAAFLVLVLVEVHLVQNCPWRQCCLLASPSLLSPEVSECRACRACRGGVEAVSRRCRGGVEAVSSRWCPLTLVSIVSRCVEVMSRCVEVMLRSVEVTRVEVSTCFKLRLRNIDRC
jgi:hypothetical protein